MVNNGNGMAAVVIKYIRRTNDHFTFAILRSSFFVITNKFQFLDLAVAIIISVVYCEGGTDFKKL